MDSDFDRSVFVSMYAFYDKKAGIFDTPFFCESDLFARRHYAMVTSKEGALLNTFKADFDLYNLGYVNKETGAMITRKECIIEGWKEVQK